MNTHYLEPNYGVNGRRSLRLTSTVPSVDPRFGRKGRLSFLELAADILATLGEYAALIARTEFHLYEDELKELRARLAEREGHQVGRAAALARAQWLHPLRDDRTSSPSKLRVWIRVHALAQLLCPETRSPECLVTEKLGTDHV